MVPVIGLTFSKSGHVAGFAVPSKQRDHFSVNILPEAKSIPVSPSQVHLHTFLRRLVIGIT
jgi:hypothetical protein